MNYFICGILLLFVNVLCANLNTEIQYGRAMQEAHQGNWEGVHNRLNQLVTDNPDRADILYDSGVAAYRLKNFESAQAYFKHVIERDDIATDLKERAHFNLGNTYVETKQLQQAIDEYEKVLDINPENQHAQDNLRLVKEMLEQEKQKQKQEEEKQKKKDQQKKDQEKQEQKKDQDKGGKNDKKDQASQDQSDQDDQKNGQKDQQQQNKPDQNKSGEQDTSDQQNKSEQNKSEKGDNNHPQSNDNAKTDDDADQEKKDGDEENQSEQSGQEDQRKQDRDGDKSPKSGLDDKQSEQKHDDKDKDEHGKEPSKDMSEKQLDTAHGNQDQQKKQESQQGHAGVDGQEEKEMNPHDRWIAEIMKQQEKSDAQANKAFIRQAINKGGSGQHGQKNW